MDTATKKESEEKTLIVFDCFNCKLRENVDYKGTKPPFARELMLKEAGYIMRDPFSEAGRGQLLVLGSDCSACGRMVCLGKECSVFYTKTFCLPCARDHLESLPGVIKSKLVQCNK